MTIPPLQGGVTGAPPLRIPVLTAPVSTGVPSIKDDQGRDASIDAATSRAPDGAVRRDDAPIALAGRLESGDLLPDTTELALALESATRLLQHGRADDVLRALDRVWSEHLDADSPWYLRAAALQLLGRTADAEQVLRNAIARLPRSAAMLYLLGVHTAARGHIDAAHLASAHALAMHPTEPLLRLQGAALSVRNAPTEAIDVLLEQIRAQDPGFPAEIWLATLIRLHDDAARRNSAPPVRVTQPRLTPVALSSVDTPLVTHAPLAPAHGALESALRYGLSLLEAPTQSARMATRASGRVARQTDPSLAALVAAADAVRPTPATLPTWEALLLIAAVLVMSLVPPMRIPALLLAGVAALALASRRLR